MKYELTLKSLHIATETITADSLVELASKLPLLFVRIQKAEHDLVIRECEMYHKDLRDEGKEDDIPF